MQRVRWSRRASPRRIAWWLSWALAFSPIVSCGGGAKPAHAPVVLPTYTPEEAALFNDLFRPELFGYPGVTPPEADTLLDERVARSLSVVPAKVVTVTLDSARRNYSVVVQPTEAPLAGRPLSDPVTLSVAANSPIFGWVEDAANAFVGTRLLLFVKMFLDGPHFHGSLDTPAVREAVVRARISAPRRP